MSKNQNKPKASSNENKNKRSARSVNKKLLKLMRRDRKQNPKVVDIMKSMAHRTFVMSRNEKHHAVLKERYMNQEMVETRASELWLKYGEVATWAACVQAVKTDWIPSFLNKYNDKLKALKDMQAATGNPPKSRSNS